MKALAVVVFAAATLAAGTQEHTVTTVATSNNTTATEATCGLGYTYCGYILKEQKNFDDATILTAYCAGGYCDSATGTTDTDPMQGLYVCLPESAVPRRDNSVGDDDGPYTGPVKIELLCACSGTPFAGGDNVCLNPAGDHIGRCSTPCANNATTGD
ncbi:hypothetical protein BD289DRAFT_250166 [Coniella lustricola]|uniref:Uncharacterized protein n=1 Tax=Coniella lustricola TaxID=2025994 RepID=A0A2T3A8U9_9PEZI|nr:hypothetical protein BD289DRAFT_250166 [Coniella lustricola]